jgi:DNA-directed RNA polymerase subunit RPC12/RpoP
MSHAPSFDYIAVVCPICHARMHARWDQAGKKIVCPDCRTKVAVPFPKLPEPDSQPRFEEIGEYDVGAAAATPPVETHYAVVAAQIYQRPLPTPPRWTYFSGVFAFPWYRTSLVRCGVQGLGFFVTGTVVNLMLHILSSGGGMFGIVGVGALGLPLIWLSLWTFSFAAENYLSIVQETANGNDDVTWPDSGWRERVWKLLYVGYVGSLAGLAGYGVGLLVSLRTEQFDLPRAATVFVLFPVMMLSSLEVNSPWAVLSWVVLKSLLQLWWGWILYYTFSGAMVGMVGALYWFGFWAHPFLTMFAAAPLLAWVVFVNARLLGRTAWRAALVAEERAAAALLALEDRETAA